MSASRVAVGEEAELVDLARRDVEPAEAWSTALTLSAAHLDGELAAWCSLHKQETRRAPSCDCRLGLP